MDKNTNIFKEFLRLTISEIKSLLVNAKTREESLFYERLLSLKMGMSQEKVVGEELL